MPWTATDIDNLKTQIANWQGAKEITFSDQTIVAHSIDDLLKLLAAMQNDVQASAVASSSTRYAAFSKGA